VRRAIDADPRPNRFYVTGSVRAEIENVTWPATGRLVRLAVHSMTIREQLGRVDGLTLFDRIAAGEDLGACSDGPDLRGYVDLALRSGFPTAALELTGLARAAWLESYVDDPGWHRLPHRPDDLRARSSSPGGADCDPLGVSGPPRRSSL